jgi:DNA invertase Pin-like site-specific DNA recombinase
MKAIGYVRVSTEEQAKHGASLDAQAERIRGYCTAKGGDWELVEVVKDEGLSGKDTKRPGLQSILDRCKRDGNGNSRPFDVVIVVKLDRLTRSVKDAGILAEHFKKNQVDLTSIDESIDTSTASGKLYWNIITSISQWEREAIGERTKAAMQHKKANGQRVGTIPYGYNLKADGNLEPVQAEQQTLKVVRQHRQKGWTLRKVAAWLNSKGIPTKAGNGGKWQPGTVWSVAGERVRPKVFCQQGNGC